MPSFARQRLEVVLDCRPLRYVAVLGVHDLDGVDCLLRVRRAPFVSVDAGGQMLRHLLRVANVPRPRQDFVVEDVARYPLLEDSAEAQGVA